MKYLKNEDSSMIVKWNDEADDATTTEILINGEFASIGIKILTQVFFTENDAKDYFEIEETEYTTIRNNKMLDYWNETAS